MTEQDLIDLGFERNDDNDGYEDYHYYTYDLAEDDRTFCLISSDNEELEWHVELFNFHSMRMTDINEVKLFIDLVERNKFTRPTRSEDDNINVTKLINQLANKMI